MSVDDPHRTALRLLNGLYDGVASPDQWAPALRQVGQALGGCGVAIVSQHQPTGQLTIEDAGTMRAGLEEGFAEMSDIDPARAAIPMLAAGHVYVDHEFHGLASLRRMPFYRDFLHPLGIGHYALLPSGNDEQHIHVMSVQRDLDRRHFSAQERELMRVVQPHLRHAINLRQQLGRGQACNQMLERALETLRFPIAICTPAGRVAAANSVGERWLAQPDCPVAPTTLTASILRLLAQACGIGVDAPSAGSMMLDGGDVMVVLPFVTQAEAGSGAMAMVAIQGAKWRPVAPGDMLRTLFGLTPAEIRLVHHLALHEEPLTVVAGQLQLSLNTLRTQLKSIFQKTNTGRQTDLLRLVGQLGLLRAAGR